MSLKEARRRIQHAYDTRATALDLSGCEIDELPPEIQRLTWIQRLRIDVNEKNRIDWEKRGSIKHLPEWLGNFSNLRILSILNQQLDEIVSQLGNLVRLEHLDVSHNYLVDLPAGIQRLTRLRYLDLSRNKLTRLPCEIGKLSQLQYFNVSDNNLSQLPREIGQLTQLQEMILTDNQLIQLPSEIQYLTELWEIDISDNKLSKLPPEIQYLTELSQLEVNNNELTELPSQLQYLTELKGLSLDGNMLTTLPSQIEYLAELERLNISNNRLKLLPPEILCLDLLRSLNVDNNGLEALPSGIAYLTELQYLDVSENRLTQLPVELADLTKLTSLSIWNNPLTIPTELTFNDSPQPVFSYLRQLSVDGARPLMEAKVILVGEPTVGKTSVVKRLIHNCYDPAESKTEGIAIERWPLLLEGGEVRLNVWDFAGQEITHATHQFFLTKRSVYLLVINCRASDHDNRLDYWLKLVQSFAPDSPVIVVGNKADQHTLDLDKRGLMLKYPQIKAFVATSCASGAGIGELRDQIAKQLGEMKHIRDVLPFSWWWVKQQLEDAQEDYISLERFQAMCAKEGVDDEFVQKVLLGLLNDLGTVLSYHDDPRLAETNVLNPEWVTNGVYTLLNHAPLLEQRSGVLSAAELTRILSKYGSRYPAAKCHFISEMMEKFELCFRIERDQWLIPDLLPKEEPDTGIWDEALHFVYRYPVLPSSIISRFIVRSQHAIEGELRWRNGVVLRSGENRALVKADPEDTRIDIRIAGDPASRRRFLSAIRHTFEQIHASLAGLRPEIKEFVPLPGHPDRLVDYEELLGLEAMDEQNYLDGKVKQRFPLRQLLDGYESSTERQGRQVKNYDEDPLDHLQALLETNQGHLRDYELQKADFGSLYVPPYVNTQIEQLGKEIERIREALERRQLRGGR